MFTGLLTRDAVAPAGIQEVSNQLYSLGKALDSVARCLPQTERSQGVQGSQDGDGAEADPRREQHAALEAMNNGCHKTLERLENLMSRYDEAGTETENKGHRSS